MGLTNLHAAKAREVGFGLVIGGAVISSVRLLVIDPAHRIVGVQDIVGVGLIGRDDGSRGNEAGGQVTHVRLVLAVDHETEGPAGTLRG